MCHYEGCGEKQYAKGYCRSHYYKYNEYGDPGAGVRYKQRKPNCASSDCPNDALIKGPDAGYCPEHRGHCKSCGQPLRRDHG